MKANILRPATHRSTLALHSSQAVIPCHGYDQVFPRDGNWVTWFSKQSLPAVFPTLTKMFKLWVKKQKQKGNSNFSMRTPSEWLVLDPGSGITIQRMRSQPLYHISGNYMPAWGSVCPILMVVKSVSSLKRVTECTEQTSITGQGFWRLCSGNNDTVPTT